MNQHHYSPSTPRSRRSLLTAAAAAGGALATQALMRPSPVAAADVVLGGVNTATAATTIRTSQATSSAKALVGHVLSAALGPSTAGVMGQSNATAGNGVFGFAPTGNSKGVWGRSATGIGVYGEATATTGTNYGVRGLTPSSVGIGVHGIATATTGSTSGVYGQSATSSGRGVQGVNTAANGTGVFGQANTGGNATGVWGRSTSGAAVRAEGAAGTYGLVATGSVAVNATSPDLIGVAGTGFYAVVGYGHPFGVIGHGEGNGVGVQGIGSSANTIGVSGQGGASGIGVVGTGGSYGVHGKGPYAVRAEATATGVGVLASGQIGVQADGGTPGLGVLASGQTGVQANGGTQGIVASGSNFGVAGTGSTGVMGFGDGIGVYGQGTNYAGDFAGNVRVSDVLEVNGSKAFVIDHPGDPANKTLAHSCVEAPEMLNIYRGTVTLDGRGRATVRMPGYFRSVNTDIGYQLTAVGAAAPELHVAREIERNSFAIAGGTPGQKVCWVVTAVRSDPWTKAHPFRVERRKRRKDQGRYLHPELYGQSRSAAMNRPPEPEKLRKPRKPPKPATVPKLHKAMRGRKPPSPRVGRRVASA